MFLKYIYDRLTTDDRVERNFAYLIFFICINSFIFIYCNPIFGAKLCTSTSLSLIGLTYIIYKYENKRFLAETCRFLIYALLLLVAITYYDGTNIIQRIFYNKYGNEILWDQKLINWDTHLFGNFWPKGQLSLYLDTNTEYGVNTSFGYLYVEILQLFYISYYGFGHMIALYLLITYYQQFYNPNKIYRRLIYRLILMFCTTWTGGFLLNYFCNFMFPAVSPRIYLKNEYVNDMHGIFFADWIKQKIEFAGAGTFGAFPSAHCGLSWIVPIISHRLNLRIFKWISGVAAIFVSIATVVLRYHYFVDFLAGFGVVIIASILGGFYSKEVFNKSVELKVLGIDEFDMSVFEFNDGEESRENRELREVKV
jgi:membrane-associated phospholipid phosphatase